MIGRNKGNIWLVKMEVARQLVTRPCMVGSYIDTFFDWSVSYVIIGHVLVALTIFYDIIDFLFFIFNKL